MTATVEPAVELPAPFRAGFAADIRQRLETLRARCPVAEVRVGSTDSLWLVLDHDDVSRCLTDPRLSVLPGDRPVRQVGQRATAVGLMNLEPPDHTRIRRLSNSALTDRRLRRYQPAIEAILRDLLAELPRDEPIDVISQLGTPFTFAVLAETFALSPAGRPELQRCMRQVFQRSPDAVAQTEQNLARIEAIIGDELQHRAEHPGDDVLSSIQAAWRADGDLDEADLISLVVMLLLAGFDSTAQMIGICAIALSQSPELGQRIREDVAAAPDVVEEILRWDTSGPFSTPRWARADIELGDTVIPQGSRVVLSFLAANNDPQHHSQADQINPDRPPGPRNLAFGLGPHFCPGSALARIELTVAVTRLAQSSPLMSLAIPADQLPWRGTYQQRTLQCLPMRLGPVSD